MKITDINAWFGRTAYKIIKLRWLIILAFTAILFVSAYGLKFFTIDSSTDNYFLEDDPMMVMTDEFKEIFGNDYFIGVLAENENIFTKESLELVRELSNELMDSVSYAEKITSLTDIEFTEGNDYGMEIVQIVPEVIPSDISGLNAIKEKAYQKPNIAKRLVSKDGKLTWIMLKLRPFPEDWKEKKEQNPENLTGIQVDKIICKEKYKELNPKATGMPYIIYKKTSFFSKETGKIMLMAMLLAILVLAFITKSIRGVIVPVLISITTIIIVYGLIGYIRYPVDMGSISMPMLLCLAIAVGYCIHVFTFFRRSMNNTGNRKEAISDALRETGWPIFFTALTTMGALLSFAIMPVKMIQFIGVATSVCVLVTFLTVIFLFPALLSFGKNRKVKVTVKKVKWFEKKLEILSLKILKAHKAVIAVTLILTAFLIVGMTKVEPAFDIEKTMGRKIPYVADILDIGSSEIGSLYSYNLMIEFPKNGDSKKPENLEKLQELSDYAHTFKLTKRTTSILDIVKDINQVLNKNEERYYTVPKNSNQVAQILLLYENSGGTESEYWMDYDYKRLRLMVELQDFNSNDAQKELIKIQKKAEEIFPEAKLSVVGNLPQFVTMMQYVVSGQVYSFFIAILVITLLLMLVFGSVKIGLIGLIPNIAPAVVIGGLMGWLDMPLDMMTVTIIPMILGLAVDDTIHFINHGKLEFNSCGNYNTSIKRTFKTVGVALISTTIIISANFLMYTTSDASMYFNLGILSVAGMMSALLADLFVTPILFKWVNIFGKEKRNNGYSKKEHSINNHTIKKIKIEEVLSEN